MSWRDLTEGVRDAAHAVFSEEAAVEFYPRDGGPMVPVSGIFRDASELLQAGEGTNIDTTSPRIGLQLSQLPGPLADGDEVRLADGRRFRIRERGLDGEGGADCILEEIEEP